MKPATNLAHASADSSLALIAAVAVGKMWFKVGRGLIGSTWESFSQPHSLPCRLWSTKATLLSRVCTTATAQTHGCRLRMHSRWGIPIFHVPERCCDAYRTLRSLQYAALYVGDPLLPHGPNVPLGQGLDLTQNTRATAHPSHRASSPSAKAPRSAGGVFLQWRG